MESVDRAGVGISAEAIRAQLEKIAASPGFADAGRLAPFLKYVVESALAGEAAKLKESVVGVEVFQRQAGYDPRTDPIVRVEARRLRGRLEQYYAGEGKDDPIAIDLPKGSYAPAFRRRAEPTKPSLASTAAPTAPAGDPPRPPIRRRLFFIGLCLFGYLLVMIGYWVSKKADEKPQPGAPSASIAVIPFANFSPDANNEYFSEGLTTELTDALTKVDGLRVVAYPAAQAKNPDVRDIGKRLRANAVLEGSVRKSGDRLRITAQLIDANTGYDLWSQTYERELKDVFAIQEEIARSIANALRIQLKIDPNRRLATRYTQNLDAYNAYLRGRYHLANPHSDSDLAKSIEDFQQAIQLDPSFAAAYAQMANSYVFEGYYRKLPGSEAWPKAKAAAKKAIDIDNSLAEAHASLGFALGFGDWDWAGSEREFRRALELNPGSPDVHISYAIAYLAPTAHLDAAYAESRLGVDSDPLSFIANYGEAWILLLNRRFDAAVEQYRKALDLNASIHDPWWDYGMAYALAGKPQQAMQQFRHAGQMNDGDGWEPGAIELALLGRMDEARKRAETLKQSASKGGWRTIDLARCFAMVGDKDTAFAYLEKAFAERDGQLIWLKVDPRFDALRDDARFNAMLKRVGLE
jgi:TolB-like protein/Tfp pilus assembly protein PilF